MQPCILSLSIKAMLNIEIIEKYGKEKLCKTYFE